MDFLRMKDAANYLGVSTITLRKYCNEGKVPYSWSITKQRIFDKTELSQYKNSKLGIQPSPISVIYYARSSSNDDASIESQLSKLTTEYGEPTHVFKDKGSGLNDKRKGLNSLLNKIEDNHSNGLKTIVYVTQKDRLTRFGIEYLERFFKIQNAEFISINDEITKEPEAVLMNDFMSLIASFSGKFYRLRGWKEQKQLIEKAKNTLEEKQNV